ncbi:38530_t:CDS:2, partial [Gigaspora margarita]
TTTGQIPTKKCNHASVYIPQHNRILLFYGVEDVTINSLDTLTFTWTIPVILNSGGPLRSLVGHTSTLIGTYVLIAFDSYKWVTTYDSINSIQPIPTSPTSPTSPSNINIGLVIVGTIVGMIVGGIFGMIIESVMGFLRQIIERTNINRVNYDQLP